MFFEMHQESKEDQKGKNPDRHFIPAKAKLNPFAEDRIFKACAYCRVSIDSDMQLSSFELQTEHYQTLAGKHKNWDLRKIYADDSDIFEPSQKALMNQAVFMIWSNFLPFGANIHGGAEWATFFLPVILRADAEKPPLY